MQSILVIGGAGYVGGLTTNLLQTEGYNVTVFDNLIYEERFLKNIPFIFGDIRDTNHLLKIHKQFDTIIWLAAIVGDGACSQDTELTHEINYYSIKRFLDKTKRRIIFPSTCSVYGAQHKILDEKSPTRPLSIYAQTKLMAESIVLENNGLCFRLGTLFGLGDSFSRIRLDLVVNFLTYKSIFDKKIKIFGGEQWRPILSVHDVAKYFVEAITHKHNDIFNLSYKNVKIIELAETFKSIFPELEIEVLDIPFEDTRNYKVNTDKINSLFNFKPTIPIESEISKLKELLISKRIKNPKNVNYYNTHHVKEALNTIKEYNNG